MIPILETERLVMREWRLEDSGPMADFYADEELSRRVGGPGDAGAAWRACAVEAGHWVLRGFGQWVLEEKASCAMVGWAGLSQLCHLPELQIAWALFRAYHGKGYATEAVGRARDHAYCEMGRTTLVSYIAPDNHASKRVALRLGAVHEHTIDLRGERAEVFRHPGPEQLKH
jgi:RimJ/RimL family protein N-acetyltransferase